jgi:hypothetical protein
LGHQTVRNLQSDTAGGTQHEGRLVRERHDWFCDSWISPIKEDFLLA